MMDTKKPVQVRVENQVMQICLNRPEDENRINREAMQMIEQALKRADEDADIRVVVLRGDRRNFCSGGRVEAGCSQEEKDRYSEAIRNMQRKLTEIRVPVIAAVEGDCVAGGNDLLASSDIAIARKGVKFGFPEILHGGFPVMVMINTIDVIPKKRLLPAFYGGELFGTDEALAYGLVTAVVEAESFEDELQRYIDMIVSKPARQIEMGRRAYYKMCPMSYEERVEYGVDTLDAVLKEQDRYGA